MQNVKTLQETYNLILKEAINPACDCCQYFDFNSLEMYAGYENPIYYYIAKQKSERLIYMSPDEYMDTIAKEARLSRDEMEKYLDKSNISRYAQAMLNGSKFPIGFYSVGAKNSQEGRHRALALKSIGCTSMPVIKMENISFEDMEKFVRYYKEYSKEELNSEFIKLGYNGITELDWRELQNYIKYRLDD